MANGIDPSALAAPGGATPGWQATLANVARDATPPLLFGLRLWAGVCLAMYVAFWLELDEPFWAGTSAAIMSQPQLGASLRKGWFRIIGTIIGAVAIVLLAMCFPQDRVLFLFGLALWVAACAFVATLLKNFATYAASLAGYTALIVGGDALGATGGLSSEVFMLAVMRASETCVGIVAASIVFAGTDFGDAHRRLATLLDDLTTRITTCFMNTLATAGLQLSDTQRVRRQFIRQVIALDPVIDQSLGESFETRYRAPILHRAVDGLFDALAGWRGVANHLARLPAEKARRETAIIRQSLPRELNSLGQQVGSMRWMNDPSGWRRITETGAVRLIDLPATTPSLRLVADEAARSLIGLSHALNGLALLVADPTRSGAPERSAIRWRVADWLPAMVNAGRAFVAISAISLFWIVTAWPSGAEAITFTAIAVALFALRGDQAYATTISFAVGVAIAAVAAAVIAFAVLPNLDTFVGFGLAIGAWLVPTGAIAYYSRKVAFTYMAAYFVPVLAPMNQMTYDTAQFYNSTLAIIAGCGVAALFFRLLPPLSPALRTRRLLALTLRDLRRLATGPVSSLHGDWADRTYARLAAAPDEAEPVQRAQLVAALSVGVEIIELRAIASRIGVEGELHAALGALASGNSATTRALLDDLDDRLASLAGPAVQAPLVLRARSRILAICDALDQHRAYFDGSAYP